MCGSVLENPEDLSSGQNKNAEKEVLNYEAMIPIGCYKLPVSRPNTEVSDYRSVFNTVREKVMTLTQQGELALKEADHPKKHSDLNNSST